MKDWLTECGARLIHTTTLVDKAYRYFERGRCALVLASASDAVLVRYSDLVYGATRSYLPGSAAFRRALFGWEARAIDRYFPPPPGRVLIGGAGGGREAFALAERGYDVVAFEPARALVQRMAASAPAGLQVTAYRGGYETLPHLWPVEADAPPRHLEELSPFDAAIIGWSSFSHLRTEVHRLKALADFARVTCGPVLVSFFSRGSGERATMQLSRLRRLVPYRLNRDPANDFAPYIGFCRWLDTAEIEDLAGRAGLKVLYLSVTGEDGAWPHAVLARIGAVAP